ncbi:hypothetical protein [Streptomyces iconiensis]|uniref:Uncharacterized protein n=1 Tax=Streptomyces iconiensis TaxID=1384038 RepID=A0ABT6ZYP8_9ACTN|nr:hypothetical protein [Streptomyces iconiensis]MDJ1134189.1 hypothetical protein [Streptomyces iconiensis]
MTGSQKPAPLPGEEPMARGEAASGRAMDRERGVPDGLAAQELPMDLERAPHGNSGGSCALGSPCRVFWS